LNLAIKIKNLSKRYKLGVYSAKTFQEDLQRLWWQIRGKDSLLLNIEQKVEEKKFIWALKDINLEIKQGEIVGIIGKNGAGKSTLLKILSRITTPTTGIVKIKGRLGSLLEVGIGFHPELTGRENVYLNGTILGMTRKEIAKKFDDIVNFAAVEKYIDTPVKRYSSGMYVRLGFAIAAFLDPEILVVDEVLAIGDVEFQKKAIGKMQDVSQKQGRTVLFVSHNLASIRKLCNRAILLENGIIKYQGDVNKAIEKYISSTNLTSSLSNLQWTEEQAPGNEKLKIISFRVLDKNFKEKNTFLQNEFFFIEIIFKLYKRIAGYRINVWFKTVYQEIAFVSSSHYLTENITSKGTYKLLLTIPANLLNSKTYFLDISSGIPGIEYIIKPLTVLKINIISDGSHGSSFTEDWPGIVAPKLKWKIQKL